MSVHLGKEYYCVVCTSIYVMTEELLNELELTHENGEHLSITTALCPLCESFSIVEGMNQITWILNNKESN